MSFFAWRAFFAAVSLVVSGIGCLAAPMASRGHPLFRESGGRLPINQVATLIVSPSAVITTVDGREVSGVGINGVFELLPGCHVVEIKRRHVVTGRYVLRSGDLGPSTFVLDMKPGYDYTIVGDDGSSRTIPVQTTEQDPSGARTRTIDPVIARSNAPTCPSPDRS